MISLRKFRAEFFESVGWSKNLSIKTDLSCQRDIAVILITPDLADGGVQKVVSILSEAFSDAGFFVKTIIFHGSNNKFSVSGELLCLGSGPSSGVLEKCFKLLYRIVQLRKIVGRYNNYCIFSFGEAANVSVALSGLCVNVSVHNDLIRRFCPSKWRFLKLIYSLPNVKNIIAVSKSLEVDLVDKGFKNVRCIYNPMPLIKTTFGDRSPHHRPYILAVGRLDPVKNYSLMIDAYNASGLSEFCDLVILGDGVEREAMSRRIQTFNLTSHVHLKGWVPNVTDYYKSAAFLVLSSLSEALPCVISEAMAQGCPVLSTRCSGGIEEMLNFSDQCGVLVDNNDTDQLARAMHDYYWDEQLRLAHSSAGMKNIADMTSSSFELYCELSRNTAVVR